MKNQKGFTLIELLIVIVIIGILAVAFLPTLLGAPQRARDTQRVADVQKIQKVLIDGNLQNTPYPATPACITSANAEFDAYVASLGGTIPTDPLGDTRTYGTTTCANGGYHYEVDPSGGTVDAGTYTFGLFAQVEDLENANTGCAEAIDGTMDPAGVDPDDDTTWCYAILTQ